MAYDARGGIMKALIEYNKTEIQGREGHRKNKSKEHKAETFRKA